MTWNDAMWRANISVARAALSQSPRTVDATGEPHGELVRLSIALHRATCRAVVQSWSMKP